MKVKTKYESPALVPLGALAKGSGACTTGSSVLPNGNGGGTPTLDCSAGANATQDCNTGPTATRDCEVGSDATRGCNTGPIQYV